MNSVHHQKKGLYGSPCFTAGAAIRHILLCLVFAIGLLGCSDKQASQPDTCLRHASGSIETLVIRFLEALSQKDLQTLKAMTVSEEEYRSCIWPQLPVSKIQSWQRHFDFVWGQHDMKSTYGLNATLQRYGGKNFKLVHVLFAAEKTDYITYKVHRDARLVVTNEPGEQKELKLFGSIVEMDNQFKIMSYKTR
jgi:hypothetical protein